jgi:hypothetical protein
MKNYVQKRKGKENIKFGFDQSLQELGLYIIPNSEKKKVAKC